MGRMPEVPEVWIRAGEALGDSTEPWGHPGGALGVVLQAAPAPSAWARWAWWPPGSFSIRMVPQH